jgi:spore germination cell wall hydrolase CwlJ-like protein
MILPVLDDLTLLAATVYMEASGEPFEGKLAVAWVVVNRDKYSPDPGVADVVLKPWQFSAWNTDNPQRAALQRVMTSGAQVWVDSMKAAAAALFGLLPDPTRGANFYLNPVLTRKIRGGTLPDWYDAGKVTVTIGHHEFLKL